MSTAPNQNPGLEPFCQTRMLVTLSPVAHAPQRSVHTRADAPRVQAALEPKAAQQQAAHGGQVGDHVITTTNRCRAAVAGPCFALLPPALPPSLSGSMRGEGVGAGSLMQPVVVHSHTDLLCTHAPWSRAISPDFCVWRGTMHQGLPRLKGAQDMCELLAERCTFYRHSLTSQLVLKQLLRPGRPQAQLNRMQRPPGVHRRRWVPMDDV